MSMLLLGNDEALGADISFNGPMLALPYSLQRLGFTYVRNSLKTVYQGGSLVTLAANQFGTTYDSVTGLNAFEAEPAATNLALNSVLAGGGAAPTGWVQAAGTGTSAPAASIYGDASGAIAYLQSGTAQRPFFDRAIAASANTTYTLSILIESISGTIKANDAILIITLPAGASIAYPICEANPSGGGTANITAGKLLLTLTVAATAGTVNCRIGLGCTANSTGTLQFSRPQFESGPRRTSWIATTGGTATRAADVLSTATANLPGFNAAGYTLVVDGRRDVVTGVQGFVAEVGDATASNRSFILVNTTNTINAQSIVGGVTQASISGAIYASSRFKAAYSAQANSFKSADNGTGRTEDTAGTMPAVTTLGIGCRSAGSEQFNGYIYGFKLIPVALNQAQTTALTS